MTDGPQPDDAAPSADERREIHRDLAKAHRGIDAMRTLFWTCAVAGGLWALIASGPWSAAGAVLAAVTAGGALNVRRKPALWATIIAAVLVPMGLALLVMSALAVELKGIVGSVALIVGALVSVRTMRRAERLIAAHPDHFGARRITREPRRTRR